MYVCVCVCFVACVGEGVEIARGQNRFLCRIFFRDLHSFFFHSRGGIFCWVYISTRTFFFVLKLCLCVKKLFPPPRWLAGWLVGRRVPMSVLSAACVFFLLLVENTSLFLLWCHMYRAVSQGPYYNSHVMSAETHFRNSDESWSSRKRFLVDPRERRPWRPLAGSCWNIIYSLSGESRQHLFVITWRRGTPRRLIYLVIPGFVRCSYLYRWSEYVLLRRCCLSVHPGRVKWLRVGASPAVGVRFFHVYVILFLRSLASWQEPAALLR